MAKDHFKLMSAVYLILQRGEEILLSERANTGYQDGRYSLIAGHLDGDELATSALVREVREEAGITIDPSAVTFCHLAHRLNRDRPGREYMDLFFTCTAWEGTIVNAEPGKCAGLNWFDLKNLPPNMLPLIRRVLQHVSRGVSYSEYLVEPTE